MPKQPTNNPETTAALKQYVTARTAAIDAFTTGGSVEDLLLSLTDALDSLIKSLASGFGDVAIIATGGYGRQELFPHSDVDLLLLYEDTLPAKLTEIVEAVTYPLWNLKLQVAHSTRSIEDTITFAKTDIAGCTALLDARLISGNTRLYSKLKERFESEVVQGNHTKFVEAKLAERDARHKRFGDSRYLLEPNIKDSKGGLRDLHTLYWLTRHIFGVGNMRELAGRKILSAEENELFERARHFLWTLRAHLHIAAGRAEERLTFDMQIKLCAPMGFPHPEPHRAVERLMKRYFLATRSVGTLTRIVCAILEEQHQRAPTLGASKIMAVAGRLEHFAISGERLTVNDETEFTSEPLRMLELFHIAGTHALQIHPRALQLVTRNLRLVDETFRSRADVWKLFMEILLESPRLESTLRAMNDVGLLGRLIPAFGRIVGQTQFNMYHIYTVDEHTIVALGNLRRLEGGEYAEESAWATEQVAQITSRHVLYLALLCHDVAKGRGGDHASLGESIAYKLAKRMGFSEEDAIDVAWLVRNHLLFSSTAYKRDLHDPKTIEDLVEVVQSAERLRMLLVLTVADMRAVNPYVWNSWKGELLRELYEKSEQYIRTGRLPEEPDRTENLLKALKPLFPGISEKRVAYYIENCTPAYIAAFDAQEHAAILRMLQQIDPEEKPFVLQVGHDLEHNLTQLTICATDRHGLFARLAGALSIAGANIIRAKIFTLRDGFAVDVFTVQGMDGKAFDAPEKIQRLQSKLSQVFAGKLDIEAELKQRRASYPTKRDVMARQPQVFVDNAASDKNTVIEVISADRVGLLYDISHKLPELRLSIVSAHISTYGDQAVDVFYVKDVFGMKIEHEGKLQDIRRSLLEKL